MIPSAPAIPAIQAIRSSGVEVVIGLCAKIVTTKFIPLAFPSLTANKSEIGFEPLLFIASRYYTRTH